LYEANSGTERCAADLACVYAYDSHSGTEIGSAQPGIPRVDSLAQRVSSVGHEKQPARCFTEPALPAVRWWQDKNSQIKANYMPSPHEQVSHLSAFGLSIKFIDLNIIFNFGLQLQQKIIRNSCSFGYCHVRCTSNSFVTWTMLLSHVLYILLRWLISQTLLGLITEMEAVVICHCCRCCLT